MKNTDILTAVMTQWAKPMTDDFAQQVMSGNEWINRANQWIRKYFPVSENYSIWNDISFLAMPAMEISIEPMITGFLSKMGIADEMIPEYAHKVVDALVKEAEAKGQVRLLERYTISQEDVNRLKSLLNEALPLQA